MKPDCECEDWLAHGWLCGKPECPRTIAAELLLRAIVSSLFDGKDSLAQEAQERPPKVDP
jgi:hypothetical protein